MKMKIIDCDISSNQAEENLEAVSICLGNLDGVHRGHQRMILTSLNYCKDHPMQPAVFLFKDHSEKQIRQQAKRQLTSLEDKLKLLEHIGVQLAYLKTFDQKFMSMEKESFVRDFLVKRLNTRHIVIGKDYSFGKMAEGRIKDLKEWEGKYAYSLDVVPDVLYEGCRISSTRVRNEVKVGHVEKARDMLGYAYMIHGKVQTGAKRGHSLGFPTANLALEFPYVLPEDGVYLTSMLVRGKTYYGMTDIGSNPTFGGDQVKIETHLFDFSENIYGEPVTLNFLRYERGEIRFSCVQDLIDQLRRDDQLIRKWAKEEEKKKKNNLTEPLRGIH